MKLFSLWLALLTALVGYAQEDFPYQLSVQIEEKLETDTVPWKYQVAAWEYSYIGEYQKMLESWDAGTGGPATISSEEAAYFQAFRPVSALDYILGRAVNEQLIIINEAHHQPRHRVFTTQLLQGLYDHGFRFLGLEALAEEDTLLQERGYSIQSSGYYTKEPQFGNLIREAIRIGYTLFPYEAGPGLNGKEREIEQARNIQQILEENPGAKVLLHCGFAHVVEGDYPAWEKAMAGRLKEFTGIDPLTINQERLSERSRPELHNPYLNLVELTEPSVFVREDGAVFNGPEGKYEFDIRVGHPITTYVNGRPDWLLEGGKKRWLDIPVKEISLSFPVLVLAYRAEESEDAVPVDIVELKTAEEGKKLALYPGGYRLLLRNAAGEEQILTLEAP